MFEYFSGSENSFPLRRTLVSRALIAFRGGNYLATNLKI